MSQKKTSHFNFRHNFAICWDIFYNFWSILFRNRLIHAWQCVTHIRQGLFMWYRRVETVSHTKCTKSAVIRQKHSKSAGSKVKCWILHRHSYYSTDSTKVYVNWTQRLVKISPLSFHTRVTCIETASPLSDSDVCGRAPPTPHTWTSRCFNSSIFAMCVCYTFSCMTLQKE